MENKIPAYSFVGIPAPFQEMIIRETVRPDALPLYDNLMKEIDMIGGKDLALDYLLLENQKQFGFKDKEIRNRIRSRIWANGHRMLRQKRGLLKSKWSADELALLYIYRNSMAKDISAILKLKGFTRTAQAILTKMHLIGYYKRKRKIK